MLRSTWRSCRHESLITCEHVFSGQHLFPQWDMNRLVDVVLFMASRPYCGKLTSWRDTGCATRKIGLHLSAITSLERSPMFLAHTMCFLLLRMLWDVLTQVRVVLQMFALQGLRLRGLATAVHRWISRHGIQACTGVGAQRREEEEVAAWLSRQGLRLEHHAWAAWAGGAWEGPATGPWGPQMEPLDGEWRKPAQAFQMDFGMTHKLAASHTPPQSPEASRCRMQVASIDAAKHEKEIITSSDGPCGIFSIITLACDWTIKYLTQSCANERIGNTREPSVKTSDSFCPSIDLNESLSPALWETPWLIRANKYFKHLSAPHATN